MGLAPAQRSPVVLGKRNGPPSLYNGWLLFRVGNNSRLIEDVMGKNVVICCDGTANEFAKDHTNVPKLFRVLDNEARRQS
jgi:hypothetical protein